MRTEIDHRRQIAMLARDDQRYQTWLLTALESALVRPERDVIGVLRDGSAAMESRLGYAWVTTRYTLTESVFHARPSTYGAMLGPLAASRASA